MRERWTELEFELLAIELELEMARRDGRRIDRWVWVVAIGLLIAIGTVGLILYL